MITALFIVALVLLASILAFAIAVAVDWEELGGLSAVCAAVSAFVLAVLTIVLFGQG
jgi:hypothetical protein